jgi:hypothetical protein
VVEVPVLKNGQLDRTEKIADRLQGLVDTFTTETAELRRLITPAAAPRPAPVQRTAPPQGRAVAVVARPKPVAVPNAEGREGLTGPEQRIVDAIAWLESIDVPEPEQSAVAFLAGYTYGAGSFNNPRGALRRKGLVKYLPNDRLALTDEGRHVAKVPSEPLTMEELHRKVLDVLPGPEQKLLKPLLEAYPNVMTNEDLANAAGYTPGAGSYNNPRGRLRSLGLVEYRDGGVAARSILFPQ